MGTALAWMGTHVLESVLIASTVASTATAALTKPDAPDMPEAQDYYSDKTTPMQEEETKPVEFGESDEAKKRKAAGKLQFQIEKETPVSIGTTGANINPDKPTGVQF